MAVELAAAAESDKPEFKSLNFKEWQGF